jgi:membrane-associated phospholipid phosphatase
VTEQQTSTNRTLSSWRNPELVYSRVRDNAFILLLVGYVGILIASYAYYGILFQFSLGLFFIILIPFALVLGRTTRFVHDLAPFLMLLLSYEALQGIAGLHNSVPAIEFGTAPTSTTGFSLVASVQSAFYSPMVTDIAGILYGLHFPLVMVLAMLLWYSDGTLYKRYLFALVACSYVSLLFYLLLPSAPPWYTGVASNLLQSPDWQKGSGLIPTLANIGEMIESDHLAAFPSLHAAYVVLFCYFTVKLKKIYGLISVPITVGVLFSTLYLGQHYLLDLVAGAGVALGCVIAASRIMKPASISKGNPVTLAPGIAASENSSIVRH